MNLLSQLAARLRASKVGPRAELRTVILRVTAPFVVVCSIGLAISVVSQVADGTGDFRRHAVQAAELYAEALAVPMAEGDEAAARAIAEALTADPDLYAVELRDPRGERVFAQARALPEVPGVLDRAVTVTETVQQELRDHGDTVGALQLTFHKDGSKHVWRFSPALVLWLAIGTTLLAAFVAAVIARRFSRRYGRILSRVRITAVTVDQATTALQEVSATQSSAASQAAAALAETQAVAAEVGVAATASSDKARRLDDIAGRSELEATEAIRAVTEARDAMQAVHEQSRAIGQAISRFAEKATAVGEIASTVSSLAERSNLLALNAALEASRAGEKGKAFSVVSREMRSLAEATNRSAANVKGIIAEVQGAVGAWGADSSTGEERVAQALDTSGAALEAIRAFGQSTHQLAGLGKELASAGHDQRQAIEQTVDALRQANGAASEQLEGIREVEGSAQRLAGISSSLVAIIDGRRKADATLADVRAAASRRVTTWVLLARIGNNTLGLGIFCLVVLSFALSVRPSLETMSRRAAQVHNTSVAVAVNGTLAARRGDDRVRSVLASARAQGEAEYLVLRDSTGKVLAATGSLPEKLSESAEGELRGGAVHLTTPLPGGVRLSAGFYNDDAERTRTKSTALTVLIAVMVFVGGTLIAFFVAKQYAEVFEVLLVAVARAARRMDELIGRLAATTAQQSAASAEASAALSQTRASAAEVGRGAAAAALRATLLIDGGEGCGHDADVATEATAKANVALAALRTHVSELAAAISGFSERAEAIGSVATTVSMLAERSDLLAVNASIEAARAASATAGFTVVAEQMRALADGSSRAANEVKEIVTEVRGALARALDDAREGERRVRAAEALSEAATRRVAQFAEVAREFVKVGNELGAAAAKQQTAIEQMVDAIGQAAEGSTIQAAGTDSVQAVANRLVELSRGLVEATTSRKERAARIGAARAGRRDAADGGEQKAA